MSGQAAGLADGQWHRLHPATPLLRGGIAFVAILGIVLGNLRERLVNLFLRTPDYGEGDAFDQIYSHGLTGWVISGVIVVLLLCIGAFYLSWRLHSFRIGEDSVDVRSGLIFRTQRSARLDRIQGINLSRPALARLFGATRLEINVAGQDANVQLAYLGSGLADDLRREILRLASGSHAQGQQPAGGAAERQGLLGQGPLGDLASRILSEDDFHSGPPESLVRIPLGRLFGSIVLSGFTVFLALIITATIVGTATGHPWALFAVLPGLLGAGSFYLNRFTKSLRYSISGSPDGIRIGFGLLATSSETLPPGRIHALEVSQPLLWRPAGWWQIRVDTAGHSSAKGAAGQDNTTILPVGTLEDAKRVLGLVLPAFGVLEQQALIEEGMASRNDRYLTAPARAAWLRPFSWRRTGYTIAGGLVVLRTGAIWRRVVVVPLARLQSVAIKQGPVRRILRLASAELHTVAGPVQPALPVIAADQALILFRDAAAGAIAWAGSDTSHRWAAVPRLPAPGDHEGVAS